MPFQASRRVDSGKVSVFAPHPDDEVLGCGGALALHSAAGDPIDVVIVTDGGAFPSGVDYVATRAQESRRAAQALGYPTPTFWGLADRGLEYGEPLVEKIRGYLEAQRPVLVYAPSPTEIHPDHLALGLSVLEAVRRADCELRLAFYEIGVPLHPNLLLDITAVEARKQAALSCFESQLARQRYDEQVLALNHHRTYTLSPSVKAAEAFLVSTSADVRKSFVRLAKGLRPTEAAVRGERRLDAPLVSVIVRTTGRRTLGEALDSIALQTYPHVEVVVVDVAGAGALQLPETCGRFPIRVCGAGRHLGRGAAANTGLAQARGRFLLFLDDDDWIHPSHLASLADALERSNARVAYTGTECIEILADGAQGRRSVSSRPFEAKRMLCDNMFPLNAGMFDRTLLETSCHFDEALELFEDWDFWLQLSLHTDFVHVPQISAVYRWPPGSGWHLTSPSVARAEETFLAKWRPRFTDEQMRAIWLRARRSLGEIEALHGEIAGLSAQLAMRRNEAERLSAEGIAQQQQAAQEHARLADVLAVAEGRESDAVARANRSEERACVKEQELQAARAAVEEMSRSSAVRSARFLHARAPQIQQRVGRAARALLDLLHADL